MDLGQLLTEQRNPESAKIDTAPTEKLLGIINAEDGKVAAAVELAIPQIAQALDAIVARVERGGRLFYIGAGTSGRLGVLDAAECPPTFSVSPDVVQGIIAGGESALSRATEATEDDPAMGAKDLLGRGFGAGDVLVGIAASGRTPYVLGALEAARGLGALTVGLSCVPSAGLSKAAEVGIEVVVGPEVLTGSTRMKSGTATKLVLNMLSTGLMIRLGCTFGNLMVNVQPKNQKLVDRAERIISEATGVSRAQAAELLEQSGRKVKVAIVMSRLGVDRQAAEWKLEQVGGRVALALSSQPGSVGAMK